MKEKTFKVVKKKRVKYFCGKNLGKKKLKKKYFGNIFFLVFAK